MTAISATYRDDEVSDMTPSVSIVSSASDLDNHDLENKDAVSLAESEVDSGELSKIKDQDSEEVNKVLDINSLTNTCGSKVSGQQKQDTRKAVTEGARDSIGNDEYSEDTIESRKHKDLAENRESTSSKNIIGREESQSCVHSLGKVVLSIALKAAYTTQRPDVLYG